MCIHHHRHVFVMAYYTEYSGDFPHFDSITHNVITTHFTARNHTTRHAEYYRQSRILSAHFLSDMPAHFRPYFTLTTACFQFGGSTVHRTTAAIIRRYCFYAPGCYPSYTVFYTVFIRPHEIAHFFHSCPITRAILQTPAKIPATFPAILQTHSTQPRHAYIPHMAVFLQSPAHPLRL